MYNMRVNVAQGVLCASRQDRKTSNRKKEAAHMKVREVLDWLQCEEPKTSYAAGIKAYADQMLRNYSGGAGR